MGFAAQRTIATLLAGVQIALTRPIRGDDVVTVENEWGRKEEITLTPVVVCIWEVRRLVVPVTSRHWDGKVHVLHVTDARAHPPQVRALASAVDAGTAWDLRCEMRETLITFVQREHLECRPRIRTALEAQPSEQPAGWRVSQVRPWTTGGTSARIPVTHPQPFPPMSLEPLRPIDTRALFRPVSSALVALLRSLPHDRWNEPTVAGSWVVRDIVAHMLDTTLRRLSFHRDGLMPPLPPHPIASERDFVDFINGLNASWGGSARRLSPRVLTDLYALASGEAADWYESLPLDAPALFPVSWAGEQASAGWFDLGREFTEVWHHQQQIRMAVGAAPLGHPRYLAAVIDIAMRGLPHAFRDVPAESGHAVVFDIAGASGGRWALVSDGQTWTLFRGEPSSATARLRLSDDTAWQVLFNALPEVDAARRVDVQGAAALGRAFLRARSVIV